MHARTGMDRHSREAHRSAPQPPQPPHRRFGPQEFCPLLRVTTSDRTLAGGHVNGCTRLWSRSKAARAADPLVVATRAGQRRRCSATALHHSSQRGGGVVRRPTGTEDSGNREEEVHEMFGASRRQNRPPPGTRPAPVQEPRPQEGIQRYTGVGFELVLDPVVPQMVQLVEVVRPVPAVFQASSPVVEYFSPAPAVFQALPVVDYVASVPSVIHALLTQVSPVMEYIASSPAVIQTLPVVEYVASAPAVCQASPVVEYTAPAPAVSQSQAPVMEHFSPTPAVFPAPAPMVDFIAPAPAVSFATARFSRSVLRSPKMAEQLVDVPVPAREVVQAWVRDANGQRWSRVWDSARRIYWWLLDSDHVQWNTPPGITASPGRLLNTGQG